MAYGYQIAAQRAELSHGVETVVAHATLDAISVNLVKRLLIPARLAAVGHGLVERLEVFERGIGLVRCPRAEVSIEPLVRCAPCRSICERYGASRRCC